MRLFKKVTIPSGETVHIDAHDTWNVRWYAQNRDTRGLGYPPPCVEVFPSHADAERFATELRSAAKLLNDKDDGWGPWVEKNQYKGVQ